ncbi:M48 family metalloprotease [Scrofimicrobium sp. R131]|uniref:Protease HtpX homolog n=1 Tax=Scrofimicrobium appendicitidis TaxID=3079930 RepID=A0AAU7V6Z0_9ACTO
MRRVENSLKTLVLFLVMWGILLILGGIIAGATRSATWIWVFAGLGLASTLYTYWNSAQLALRQMRAYPVTREQAPGLYAIVEDLSARMEMPTPSIWIAPSQTPNAFATGRNPKNAAVCCTEGILQLLDERQLRGVLGHELMHVYNRDILTASVASAIGGLIASLAQFAFIFGGRERGGNPIAGLLMMILAPIAATMVQLGISRTREYSADADGATLTQDPLGLASALETIERGVSAAPMAPNPAHDTVSSMMIANPFRGQGVAKLFSTHPPMEDRIARLRAQAQR